MINNRSQSRPGPKRDRFYRKEEAVPFDTKKADLNIGTFSNTVITLLS
jgi:hypothetical protein